MTSKTILAIDPSLSATGLCRATWWPGTLYIDELACIETGVEVLHDRIHSILHEIQMFCPYPDYIVIEDAVRGANVKSLVMQSELIGAIIESQIHHKIVLPEITRVHPMTVKKHFTGNGRAGKEDMVQEAERFLDIKLEDQTKVVAEAMSDALAICCYLTTKAKENGRCGQLVTDRLVK